MHEGEQEGEGAPVEQWGSWLYVRIVPQMNTTAVRGTGVQDSGVVSLASHFALAKHAVHPQSLARFVFPISIANVNHKWQATTGKFATDHVRTGLC